MLSPSDSPRFAVDSVGGIAPPLKTATIVQAKGRLQAER
jgi:hypothetical protein